MTDLDEFRRRNEEELERLRGELREREDAERPMMEEFKRHNDAELERLRRMRDGD